MTVQRRRGQALKIYRTKVTEDKRGNRTVTLDLVTPPHKVRAWVVPDRSARAEVPGQQQIDVIKIGTTADLKDVTLWSRVEYDGKEWDVVTPPAYHHGTRHTRHWTLSLRRRP